MKINLNIEDATFDELSILLDAIAKTNIQTNVDITDELAMNEEGEILELHTGDIIFSEMYQQYFLLQGVDTESPEGIDIAVLVDDKGSQVVIPLERIAEEGIFLVTDPLEKNIFEQELRNGGFGIEDFIR